MSGQDWRWGGSGLVAGAAHDVFVSYASINNEPYVSHVYDERQEGWVSRVVRTLRLALAERLGRSDFRIWLDLESRDVGRLDDALSGHVSSSALFLFILSRASLASAYCAAEFVKFLEVHAGDYMERLVVVDMDNCLGSPTFIEDLLAEPRRDIPSIRRVIEECRRQIRIECFRYVDAEHICTFDNPPEGPRSQAQYQLYKKVTDVAVAVANKLTNLRRRARAAQTNEATPERAASQRIAEPIAAAAPAAVRVPVFLALARASGRERRDELVRYLAERPEVELRPTVATSLWPDADSSDAFQRALEPLLVSSSIFVLILGQKYPKSDAIAGDYLLDAKDLPVDYLSLQLDLAERMRIKPLVWCSPEIDDKDLDPIEADIRRSRSVIEDGFESFKRMLDAQIARCLKSQSRRPATVGQATQIFLNFAEEDRPMADPLIARYQDRFTVLTPANGASPSETRELNDEFYRSCDAAVFFDCMAPVRWINAQLMQFTKVRASRTNPIRTLAAFRSESRPRPAVRVPGLQLIDVVGEPGAAAVSPMLDQLLSQFA
jgi:hypothetical protein